MGEMEMSAIDLLPLVEREPLTFSAFDRATVHAVRFVAVVCAVYFLLVGAPLMAVLGFGASALLRWSLQ